MKNNSRSRRSNLLLAAALSTLTGMSVFTAPADAAIGNNAQQNTTNPSGLADMLRQAQQAMAQGHPNVAIIYLKNAAALAPKNTGVRVQLGYAYLKSGDPQAAVRELRAARQAGAPDAQVLPILFDAMLAHSEASQLLDQFAPPKPEDRSQLAAIIWRARGLALAATGHIDDALPSIDQALSISRDAQSLVVRARLAKDKGDLPGALKYSDEAYAKSPNDPAVLLLRISLLQSDNKPDQALAVADKLVKAHPESPVSLLSRASVFMQMRQDDKARADVDGVLSRWKNLPQAIYTKALLQERAKDVNGAWQTAQTLPPEFIGSRPELAMMVAQMAIAANHADVGITILASAVGHFPNAVDARIALAAQYLRINNSQRALDTLMPLKDSGEPRVMALLGQAYAAQKQFAKSTEYFEKATTSGFGGDLLKRQLAATNIQRGDLDTAVKQLREINAKQPGDQVTAGLLITALIRSNDVAGASIVADKFTAAAPKNPYGPLFQGQVLVGKSDFKGAVGAFSRALTLDPKFELAFYDRAIARSAAGDLAGANADLRSVLAIDGKNVMAMIRSAELLIRMGQDAQAQATLQRAVAADPKNPTPNLALASFYISRNRMKEAAATVGAFLKLVPNDPNAQMVQAEIQLAGGQVDPALATFRRIAGQLPNSPQVQLMIASALVAKKDTNGAISAYRKSLALGPKFTLARQALVRYALSIKNNDLAVTIAMEGTKVDPGSQSDLLYASVLQTVNKPDQALSFMKQAMVQHPAETSTVYYSQLLRQANKAKQADAVLSEWIAKHPSDVGTRLELAQQQMQATPDAAEQQFRAVLKADPNNTVALNNLSWLLQKKDPKQAIVYAEQAAKLAPNSAPVLDTLGWVKWRAKDASGALAVLQKAHAADPNNAEIAYHLAVALDGNGRRAEAKKTLAAVMASNQQFSERADAVALNTKLR